MAINDISLTAGMRSNLLSLQNTVTLLNRTQNRLSSGNKINTALDNPTSYFTAQVLNARAAKIDGLKDAMGQAIQTVTAADKGISGITALIEQAKGIAQSALSATTGSTFDSETITLNSIELGQTIAIRTGGTTAIPVLTTLTAGPNAVATSTAYTDFTMTFTSQVDAGDTVKVGGITFSATAGSSATVYDSFDVDLTVAADADTIKVGGVTFTATIQTSTTVQNSIDIDVSSDALVAGNQITIGGVAYTATSGVATTTYNSFTVDFDALVAGNTITVGGHAYTATAAAVAGVDEFSINVSKAAGYAELVALINTDTPAYTVGAYGRDELGVVDADTFVIWKGTGSMISTSVQATGAIVAGANTTVTSFTAGDREFDVSAGVSTLQQAANLGAVINANQGSGAGFVYNVAVSNNIVTITAGSADLSAGTVVASVPANVTIDVSDATTTANALRAGEFNVGGTDAAAATSLRAAIMALVPDYAVTVTGAGSDHVTIAQGTASSFDVTSVEAGSGSITFTPTTSTDANALGATEYLIGATAILSAANLAAKLVSFFGTGAGAGLTITNTGGSNVVTVAAGTQALSEFSVVAGTDPTDPVVAASTLVTTSAGALGALEFSWTGDDILDAQALASAINNNATISAHHTATANSGVITLTNNEQDIEAGDVTGTAITAGTMIEASVSANTELTTLQNQYNTMLDQIDYLAGDSGYKGKNLLNSDTLSVQFEGTAAILDVVGTDATYTGLSLTKAGIAYSNDWATSTNIDADIVAMDAALTQLRSAATSLSGNLSIITVRQDFSTNMINTLTEGSNKLTLADTNEEGANMLMLQTRQSLSTTALSLSAQAAQSVLRLFQ